MTRVLKKSMMAAALVAVFAAAQTSYAVAQTITPSGPSEAQVILDLDSGDVTVDLGSDLIIFGIQTLNTLGFFDNAAAENALLEFGQPFSAAIENSDFGIGVFNVDGLPTGSFNLGPIIPEGSRTVEALTDAGFNFVFAGFGVEASPDFGIGDPPVILVSGGEVIPEPSSLSLLALGGLAALARRRR